MSLKKDVLKGTMILTIGGLITRFLGLYNRVFLANLISPAEIGIYQLIFPVYLVCHSLCSSGIETSIAKMTAAISSNRYYGSLKKLVRLSLGISLLMTALISVGLYMFCGEISMYFLKQEACTEYLKILAFIMPFSTIHSCILGYFLGLKRATIPAVSQFVEQIARVCAIYILSITFYQIRPDASMAVYGMLAGEVVACIFTIVAYGGHMWRWQRTTSCDKYFNQSEGYHSLFSQLMAHSIPLTINRVALNGLHSVESILIPLMLYMYYGDQNLSLEIFGVLTGMALPFILFPTTLTNSLATMLLPTVSEANASHNYEIIKRTTSKSLHYCLLIGILSMAVFILYGNAFGMIIFKNELAGQFLKLFAFLCPFMYTSSTLTNVLTGLGETKRTLIYNMISLVIRIGFILIAIPSFGLKGYLWGLLLSYIVLSLMTLARIQKRSGISINIYESIICPAIFATAAGLISLAIYRYILNHMAMAPLLMVGLCCILVCVLYGLCLIYTRIIDLRELKRI